LILNSLFTFQGLSSAPPLNELGWHSITRATINAAPFLAFGAIMCGWAKPVLEEFTESFDNQINKG
jgi:hypothetical protein